MGVKACKKTNTITNISQILSREAENLKEKQRVNEGENDRIKMNKSSHRTFISS